MKYIKKQETFISDSFYGLIHQTADKLSHLKYIEGEKFVGDQQEVVTNFGEKLEDIVNEYLFPHIYIVRKFNYPDKNLILDILKTVNAYKRKGVIASLKLFRSDVGVKHTNKYKSFDALEKELASLYTAQTNYIQGKPEQLSTLGDELGKLIGKGGAVRNANWEQTTSSFIKNHIYQPANIVHAKIN